MIRHLTLENLRQATVAMLEPDAQQRVLFMTGEAGIGKTTLLRELQLQLETEDSNNILVARTECSTPVAGQDVGEVEALKPFADVLADLITHAAEPQKSRKFSFDVGKFLLDTAPSWIGMIPLVGNTFFHALNILGSGYDQYYLHGKISDGTRAATSQDQVFRQYLNFLRPLAAERPLVIILDDFHWADPSSTNLLFTAARELQDCRLCFVVAYREEDVLDALASGEHPIVRVRHELERYSLCKRVDVPHVSNTEIDVLLRERFPEYRGNNTLVQWLEHSSGGNMLFVTQFLSVLVEDGFLDARSAAVLKDLDLVRVPDSAHAVVSERLRRLSADERELLRYASVEGETFSAQVVSGLVEVPLLKTLQRLRLIEEEHRVIRSLGRQNLFGEEVTAWQFVHTVMQKALYDDLSEDERDILHGMLYDRLAAGIAGETIHHGRAVRIAVHAAAIGKYGEAAEVLVKGAKGLWTTYALRETRHMLRLALVSIRRGRRRDRAALFEIECDVLQLQGDIAQHVGEYRQALTCYSGAVRAAERCGHAEKLGFALLGMAVTEWVRGNLLESEQLARRAHELASHTQTLNLLTRAERILGNVAYRRADLEQSRGHYELSLSIAEQIGSMGDIAAAAANIGNIHQLLGEDTDALYRHQQALEIRTRIGDKPGIAGELLNVGQDLVNLQRNDEARKAYEESLVTARSIGSRRIEAQVLTNLAVVHDAIGESEQAISLAMTSLEIKRLIGDIHGQITTLGSLGTYHFKVGNFDEALIWYEQAGELADGQGALSLKFKILVGMAQVQASIGDTEKAVVTLRQAIDLSRTFGRPEMRASLTAEAVVELKRILARIHRPHEFDSALASLQQSEHQDDVVFWEAVSREVERLTSHG